MRTTTPIPTKTLTATALAALALIAFLIGPELYRILQIAGTAILTLIVTTMTARAAFTLFRDLMTDDTE